MAAAYVVSCGSALIAMLVSCSSYDKYKLVSNSKAASFLITMKPSLDRTRIQGDSLFKKLIVGGGAKISNIYKDYLPTHIWQRLNSQLKVDALFAAHGAESSQLGYFTAKLMLVFLYILFILLLIIYDVSFAYLLLLAPLIPLFQDIFLLSRYRQRSSQENMRYPQWLNVMAILLNSGLSLQRSLQICSRKKSNYEQKQKNNEIDYVDLELKRLNKQISSGISPAVLIGELSDRCTLFQIKYVLDLIVRYERDGGKEILGIITLSAGSTWQVYREELKKKLQSKNLLFLEPCGLSLISVISTALIPAASMLMMGN